MNLPVEDGQEEMNVEEGTDHDGDCELEDVPIFLRAMCNQNEISFPSDSEVPHEDLEPFLEGVLEELSPYGDDTNVDYTYLVFQTAIADKFYGEENPSEQAPLIVLMKVVQELLGKTMWIFTSTRLPSC